MKRRGTGGGILTMNVFLLRRERGLMMTFNDDFSPEAEMLVKMIETYTLL